MKLNPFYPNDPIPPNLFVGRQKEVTLALLDEPATNGAISSLYKEIFKEVPSSNITVFLTNMVNDGAITRLGKSSPYLYQLSDPLMKVLLRFYPGTNQKIYDRISNYMIQEFVSAAEARAKP